MDENFLQSLGLGLANGHALSDQYSTANLAPQGMPTAQPQSLEQQYSPQTMAAPAPAPGIDPAAGNVLAQIAQASQPQAAPQPDPTAAPAPSPAAQIVGRMQAPPAPGAPLAAPAPRQRHSVLDMIGHISDVLAQVGGAHALYQPTLDANQARTNLAQDRAAAQIKAVADARSQALKDDNEVASTASTKAGTNKTGLESSAIENAVLSRAVGVVKQRVAGGADPAAAWDALAPNLSISDEAKARARAAIVANPGDLDGVSTAFGTSKDDPKYANQLTPAIGADGKLHYIQPNDQGEIKEAVGYSPVDKLTQVDTGGTKTLVDQLGETKKVLPISISPDTAANIAQRDRSDAGKADRAAAKGGKAGEDAFGMYQSSRTGATQLLQGIRQLVADPALSAATGFVAGRISTPAQEHIKGIVKGLEGLTVPIAAAALKSQGVQRAAQMEILATAKGLISDLSMYKQDTPSYIARANEAAQRLETKIKLLDTNAYQTGLIDRSGSRIMGAPRGAPATPRAPAVVPARVLPHSATGHPADIDNLMAKYGIK